jgi:hypothetical protein
MFTCLKQSHVFSLVSALVCLCSAQSGVAADVTPPNPKDLTIGRWVLQVDKSHFCAAASGAPAAPPQKSSRDIFDAGGGLVSIDWVTVQANGNTTDTRYVYMYDGKPYPSSIMAPSAEGIVWQLVNPHKVTFQHVSYKDGKVTQRLVRDVSEDGQTMTQTTHIVARPDCEDVQVFQREPMVFRRGGGGGRGRGAGTGAAPPSAQPPQ